MLYINNSVGQTDSLFISSFKHQLTGRIYLSNKYTNFKIVDDALNASLDYRPNSTLNLGIGATYGPVTLNIAYGFKFLNPENGQGKTKYLDLQSHFYTSKFAIDIYGQFYKGLYLKNYDQYITSNYVRSDLSQNLFGFSGVYIKNHKRFSYKAPLLQNEQQLKSAGTLLYGMEFLLGEVYSDSAFVPSFADTSLFSELRNINRFTFFKLGPGIGYGHTLVLKKKIFVMLSVVLNLGIGTIAEFDAEGHKEVNAQVRGSVNSRAAIGYNSNETYAGLIILNHSIVNGNRNTDVTGEFTIGNIRLVYAKRFSIHNKWMKSKLQ